jgi:hypothetical protein
VAAGLWRARPAGKKTLRRLRFGNGKGVAARVMGLPKNLHEWALWREMTQSICARIVCHYIYPRHCCTYFLYIKDGSKRPLSWYPRRHIFLRPHDQYPMAHDHPFASPSMHRTIWKVRGSSRSRICRSTRPPRSLPLAAPKPMASRATTPPAPAHLRLHVASLFAAPPTPSRACPAMLWSTHRP